jgi:hypothetical protein
MSRPRVAHLHRQSDRQIKCYLPHLALPQSAAAFAGAVFQPHPGSLILTVSPAFARPKLLLRPA